MGRPARFCAIGAMVLLLSLPAIAGSSGISNMAPDLTITGFNVTSSVDGYSVWLSVRNTGRFPSEQVWASVFDEADPVTGSGSQIARISVVTLDPGQEFSRSVDWFPTSGGSHRLWAVLDVDNRALETDKMDNAATIDVELPGIHDVHSPADGDPDPMTIGTAFSGVEAEFPFAISYSGDPDPGMVKAYLQLGDGKMEYAPTGSDGISLAFLDTGLMDPGLYKIMADVTISGMRWTDNDSVLAVREVPYWISSMGSYKASFDRASREYIFTGVRDLPTHTASIEIDGFGSSVPVKLCAGPSDVYIEVRVLTDGTTTVSARASIAVDIGGDARTITMEGRVFGPGPEEDMVLFMHGEGEMNVSLVRSDPGGVLIEPFPGASFPLLDPPDLGGKASSTVELRMGSGSLTAAANVSLEMKGEGLQALSDASWGLDSPYSVIITSLEWDTIHTLEDRGRWSVKGGAVGKASPYFWDLGLSFGDLPQGFAPGSSRGLSVLDMSGGNLSSVMIHKETESITGITYIEGERELRLHRSNLYKSTPRSVRLPDGNVLISWTEATSYSEDPVERYSSLRAMYGILDIISGDLEGPFSASGSTSFSPFPVLMHGSGDPALFHIIDDDSDPRTRDDMRLVMSGFEGRDIAWMANVTEGNVSHAIAGFGSIDGDAVIGWMDGRSIGLARVRENGTSSHFAPVTPGGQVISIDIGPFGDGSLALAYSTLGKGEALCSVEVLSLSIDGTPVSGPDTIMSGLSVMDSVSIMSDPFGGLSLSFRESRQGTDSVYVSMARAGNGPVEWLPPLRIAADAGVKLSPNLLPLGDGAYKIGWIDPPEPPGRSNGTYSGRPFIAEFDLSHAADVVHASHSLKGSYVPGDMVVVSAQFQNRGFRPDAEVTVEFIKAVRDPLTGMVAGQSTGTRTASFDSLSGLASLDVPMLVSENQLGVHVMVVSPRWAGPDHESSAYLSIPAVADPVIEDVSYLEGGNGSLRIDVTLNNRGSLSTGNRRLSVLSTDRTLPTALPDRIFEPSLLRKDDPYSRMDNMTVHIGPFERRTYTFDLVLGAGVGDVRVGLEGRPWEEDTLSDKVHRHVVLPRITTRGGSTGTVHSSRSQGIHLLIANEGACSIGDVLDLHTYNRTSGLVPLIPSSSVDIVHATGTLTSIEVTDIGPGSILHHVILDGLEGLSHESGVLELVPEWDGRMQMLMGMGSVEMGLSVMVVPSATLNFTHPHSIDTVLMTHRYALGVNNTSERTVRVLVLNLHNGLPGEGELISSVILMGLRPGEVRNASIPLNIGEGVFFLHLEILEMDRTGNGGWDVILSHSGEFLIRDQEVPVKNGDKATPREIESSLIIAGSLAIAIILLALLNRAYEEFRKGKE